MENKIKNYYRNRHFSSCVRRFRKGKEPREILTSTSLREVKKFLFSKVLIKCCLQNIWWHYESLLFCHFLKKQKFFWLISLIVTFSLLNPSEQKKYKTSVASMAFFLPILRQIRHSRCFIWNSGRAFLIHFPNFPFHLKSFPLLSRQFPIGQDPDQDIHFWIPELFKYQVVRNQDDPNSTSAWHVFPD